MWLIIAGFLYSAMIAVSLVRGLHIETPWSVLLIIGILGWGTLIATALTRL